MLDDADFDAQLRSLLAEDRKIDAMKLYRQRTGVGLAEAKEAVEALALDEAPPPAVPRREFEMEQELIALLEQGRTIEAIKLYRARTGVGLKDAKDAVDAIAAKRCITPRRGCGCLGAACFLVVAFIAGLSLAGWSLAGASG